MSNKPYSASVVPAVLAGLWALFAALPVADAGEITIQEIMPIGTTGGVAPAAQVQNHAYWNFTGSDFSAYLVVEMAGYAANNAFGIYLQGRPDTRIELFKGSDELEATFSSSIPLGWTSFGFYLENTASNYIWYSDTSLNGGAGQDHLAAYQGAAGLGFDGQRFGLNDFVLGWEDLDLGDADFNDMVVVVHDIHPASAVTAVPDGGNTAILLGLALGALALFKGRRVYQFQP